MKAENDNAIVIGGDIRFQGTNLSGPIPKDNYENDVLEKLLGLNFTEMLKYKENNRISFLERTQT